MAGQPLRGEHASCVGAHALCLHLCSRLPNGLARNGKPLPPPGPAAVFTGMTADPSQPKKRKP